MKKHSRLVRKLVSGAYDYDYECTDYLYVSCIYRRADATSPREWRDNLGVIVTFSAEHNLSDEKQEGDFSTPREFLAWARRSKAIYLPIFLSDRDGVSVSTHRSESCSHIGWIYTTPERARRFGIDVGRRGARRLIKQKLESEVEALRCYLTGSVYSVSMRQYELVDNRPVFVTVHSGSEEYDLEEARARMRELLHRALTY